MKHRQPFEIAILAAGVAALLAILAAPNLAFAKAKDEPKWIEVHTAHFSVITDAGEKRGREVVLERGKSGASFGKLSLKKNLQMPGPSPSSRLRVTSNM